MERALSAAPGGPPGRGPAIGVLAPLLETYYYAAVVEGLHAVIGAHGGRVLAIDTTRERGRALPLAALPLDLARLDGLLVILDALDDQAFAEVVARGLPVVSVSRPPPGGTGPYIIADNAVGMRAVVGHLVAHGHRRIATIAGPADNEDARQRLAAYRAVLAEAGLAVEPALEVAGDWSEAAGREALETLLARRVEFSAIAVANDQMAFGVLAGLLAHGRRVPADVAVTGFDDALLAPYQRPPLTTVRQPMYDLGAAGGELLLAWLAGRPPAPGPVYLRTELVVRRSCGCPPAWSSDPSRSTRPLEPETR